MCATFPCNRSSCEPSRGSRVAEAPQSQATVATTATVESVIQLATFLRSTKTPPFAADSGTGFAESFASGVCTTSALNAVAESLFSRLGATLFPEVRGEPLAVDSVAGSFEPSVLQLAFASGSGSSTMTLVSPATNCSAW